MLRKIKPLLFVLGGLLVIGSLLGARLLTHGAGGGTTEPAKSAPGPTNGKDGSGPVVLGTVDSNPSPIGFFLPPVLQSGMIVKVFVEPGQEVKLREYRLFGGKMAIGDPLYKFNTQMLEAKLTDAQRAVDVAVANVRGAMAKQDQHNTSISTQEQKFKAAELNVNRTQTGYHLYQKLQLESLTKNFGAERAEQLLKDDPERFKLETAYLKAVEERDGEKLALTAYKTADVGAAVAVADAQVRQCEALVDEARTAIDLCTIRTKVPGTIERVNYGLGETIGIVFTPELEAGGE